MMAAGHDRSIKLSIRAAYYLPVSPAQKRTWLNSQYVHVKYKNLHCLGLSGLCYPLSLTPCHAYASLALHERK